MRPALALLFALSAVSALAGGPYRPFHADDLHVASAAEPAQGSVAENRRGVAIGLAALLGPFGAHRLYLGTTPKVAIIYGLTFGGFGVLVLIDLVHLITAKDLDRFKDSDRVLMWTTPP